MSKDTTAIRDGVYTKVQKALSNSSILSKYRNNISKFMEVRSADMHDIAPFARIDFTYTDFENFFKVMGFTEADIDAEIKKTYYGNISAFRPKSAKDPFTVAQLMCVRYFYTKKMEKETNMACIYLAFSGKFYPSIHYGSFPKVQPSEYRHVMEYVVNNMLTMKYDLKREGSLYGAIKSITTTWLDSYDDKMKRCTDEDVTYLLQQLHSRIASFMKNIAELYYQAYKDKDYLAYSSDSLDPDNFHMADNDQFRGDRYVENAMNYITTRGVDYKLCKMSANESVKTDEVKFIIESIQSDNNNILILRELITIIIFEFFQTSKSKDVTGIDFLAYALSPKPNVKSRNIQRQKEIITTFLEEGSPQFRKRRNREATANNYYRCVTSYYALVISASNK